MTPPLLADADDTAARPPPALPLPSPPRYVEVRGLRFTRRRLAELEEALAAGGPWELAREVRRALAEAGL